MYADHAPTLKNREAYDWKTNITELFHNRIEIKNWYNTYSTLLLRLIGTNTILNSKWREQVVSSNLFHPWRKARENSRREMWGWLTNFKSWANNCTIQLLSSWRETAALFLKLKTGKPVFLLCFNRCNVNCRGENMGQIHRSLDSPS